MSAVAGALPQFKGKTLMTPDHTAVQVRVTVLGRAEAKRRHRFDVYAMVGCTPLCATDAQL